MKITLQNKNDDWAVEATETRSLGCGSSFSVVGEASSKSDAILDVLKEITALEKALKKARTKVQNL